MFEKQVCTENGVCAFCRLILMPMPDFADSRQVHVKVLVFTKSPDKVAIM
jgi:hypothetical protein